MPAYEEVNRHIERGIVLPEVYIIKLLIHIVKGINKP